MACSSCFKDYLVKCNDTITLYIELAALSAYNSYTWIITDKRGHKYSGQLSNDASGWWTIDVADLPAGFLTEYSGDFKLEIQDDSCTPVKFKAAQEYLCIEFEVKGGTYVKDSIGCEF